MYWGKKILEWSKTSQGRLLSPQHFNNKYEIDGRDPNGFDGVAWCFGKHDRLWGGTPDIWHGPTYECAGTQTKEFHGRVYRKGQVGTLKDPVIEWSLQKLG